MSLVLAKTIKYPKKLHVYCVNYTIPEDKKVQNIPIDADNIMFAILEFNKQWSNNVTEVVSVIKLK